MSSVTPKANVDEIRLHAATPRPARRLKKKAIVAGATALSLLVGIALLTSLSPKPSKTDEGSTRRGAGTPGELVQSLPQDYSALAKRPKPKPTEVPAKEQPVAKVGMSDYEKFLKDMALKRARRVMEARESDLSFPKIREPDTKPSEQGGGARLTAPQMPVMGPVNLTQGGAGGDDTSQSAKNEFLRTARRDGTLLLQPLQSPVSEYQLNAGTIIPGMFITGVNSDLPGQLLGQVSQNVYDSVTGRYLLVPQGTKVLGTYDSRVAYGQERVLIVWTRLHFPNGRSITLEGMPGVDMSGYAGVKDQVNNHYLRLLTGVLFGSLLAAGAQVAEGRTYDVEPSYDELALQGAAKNANDVGQQITKRNLNVQPTLEIRPGMRFNVFTTKDIVLEPYQ